MRAALHHLSGLGPARIKAFELCDVHTIEDLVEWIPRRYIDRGQLQTISQLIEFRESMIRAQVLRVSLAQGRKSRLIVTVGDATGEMDWIFFHGLQQLQKLLTPQSIWVAYGKVQRFGKIQMVHPELESLEESQKGPKVLSFYSQPEALRNARIDHRKIRTWVEQALNFPGLELTESLPKSIRDQLGFCLRLECLKKLHQPESLAQVYAAKRQLKTEEILPIALLLAHKRALCQSRGSALTGGPLVSALLQRLPFKLTQGQEFAFELLRKGFQTPHQFQALVQGDVGSGKTAVAGLAAAFALGDETQHTQVALMAPTEILARQLYQKFSEWFAPSQISLALILGSTPSQERQQTTSRLKNGQLRVVIGTHALLSADVEFNNLALVLIDEQHRFGVEQRQALLNKGPFPDLVSLSATPIPRTLALTWYGDMDLVTLQGKPAGRQPIRTRLVPHHKRNSLKEWCLEQIRNNQRVYWVAPRIEGEEDDQASVIALFEEWKELLPQKCGLLHGQLSDLEKNQSLEAFRTGTLPLLVSTTVIEVGVDVPEASIMVIEGAERFGLSQLHQLRGRVGRGSTESWCFLLSHSEEAIERLEGFCETEDGFQIAEMDLEWRGAGNLLGKRQSGQRPFKFFDFINDQELILELRAFADLCLQSPDEEIHKWLLELIASPLGQGILAD